MLNLFDGHTHSDNSPDGSHSVTFMCERAVENGLMGIAITDHCEVDTYKTGSYQLRMLQSVFEARKAQFQFGERISICAGIELGQAMFDTETAEKAVSLQNYDVVLGSVHIARGWQDYYEVDYSELSQQQRRELMSAYFAEVLETVRWGGFDVLAHLTYPLRYMRRDGVDYDLAPHAEIIDEILRTLAKSGRALELNTSGLYGSYGRACPEKETFERFRALGGENVTLGSDAHCAENIGGGVALGMVLLRQCGYKYFSFYKKRAPRMVEIV